MSKKEWVIRIPDEEYFDLPSSLRSKAVVFYNDYEELKSDPLFLKLYKNYKKAKDDLDKYKFKVRNE